MAFAEASAAFTELKRREDYMTNFQETLEKFVKGITLETHSDYLKTVIYETFKHFDGNAEANKDASKRDVLPTYKKGITPILKALFAGEENEFALGKVKLFLAGDSNATYPSDLVGEITLQGVKFQFYVDLDEVAVIDTGTEGEKTNAFEEVEIIVIIHKPSQVESEQ